MEIVLYSRNSIRGCVELPEEPIPYMDVTILNEGTMHYRMNGREVILHEGDAIIFQPGDVRYREGRKGTGNFRYHSFNVIMEEGDAERLPYLNGVIRNCACLEIENLLMLCDITFGSQSKYARQKGEYYFLALYTALSELADLEEDKNPIDSMLQFIHDNMHRQITLKEVGDAVFLSPNYCNNLFKKKMGVTITQYITNEKMQRARDMLLRKNVSLRNIAIELGYRDYSYFSSQFKRIHGISPIQYRQNCCYSEEKLQKHKKEISQEEEGETF